MNTTPNEIRSEVGGLKFTPSGQKRMDEYQSRFAQVLRRSIRDQRTSFSDRVIEVTAADVDRALDGVKLISTKRLEYRRMIYDLYAIFGLLIATGGIFYDFFHALLLDQPTRFALITFGVVAFVISVFGRRLYRVISIGRSETSGLSFFVSDMENAHDAQYDRLLRNRLVHGEIISDRPGDRAALLRAIEAAKRSIEQGN